MKTNKFSYLYVIQGNFGYGWEDMDEYNKTERKEAVRVLREYRMDGNAYRLIERRVPNTD